MNPIVGFGVSGYIVFWGLFALALTVFSLRARLLWRYLSLGRNDERFGQIVKRAFTGLVYIVAQKCSLKNVSPKDRAGIGHVFIAWGFFLFVIYYLFFIVLSFGIGLHDSLEHTSFFYYYVWVMDFAAVFVFAGAMWAIIRRYVVKPARLKGESDRDALIILVTVLIHPLTHLFKTATAIAYGNPPAGLGYGTTPVITTALSKLFTASSAYTAHAFFFWAHWIVVLFVLAYIAYSRYLHVIAASLNVVLKSREPKGTLKAIDIENSETFGVNKITEFSRKQLLDCFACVSCGRCQDACPAYTSEKPLNPKELIQDLNRHLRKVAPGMLNGDEDTTDLIGEVIGEETVWSCTTCRSCMEVCPVANEHMPKLIEFRRNMVLEQGQMPETIMGALRSVEQRGHPWRGTVATRTDWMDGLNVKQAAEGDFDILFWVGCSNALEDRCQGIAIDTARLLAGAGVNFAVLGEEESCCGDVARRTGNEYLFQMQAMRNIETLKKYNVSKIVTTCPHCYNTIKYEYPQFEGNFEVLHHTELISELISQGKLEPALTDSKLITYHDPCYLGRYGDVYDEPRKVLKSVGRSEYIEIDEYRNKRNSFCCGGGGGRCWMEEEVKISHLRVDDAIKSGADILAVACPLCMIMFEDAVKAKDADESLKVMDIAEIVAGDLTA